VAAFQITPPLSQPNLRSARVCEHTDPVQTKCWHGARLTAKSIADRKLDPRDPESYDDPSRPHLEVQVRLSPPSLSPLSALSVSAVSLRPNPSSTPALSQIVEAQGWMRGALRNGIVLAKKLDRILILPRLQCYCERCGARAAMRESRRGWAMDEPGQAPPVGLSRRRGRWRRKHPVRRSDAGHVARRRFWFLLDDCRIPAGPEKMPMPYECPMDHIFEPSLWYHHKVRAARHKEHPRALECTRMRERNGRAAESRRTHAPLRLTFRSRGEVCGQAGRVVSTRSAGYPPVGRHQLL
jgi:hypothetical protein